MFSSIFGKRKPSPDEDATPPIPGPKPDDGFVVVSPSYPGGGIYPSVGGLRGPGSLYPHRPAPAAPVSRNNGADHSFHYLQGVPFSLSKELQLASNKDNVAGEIGNLLSYAANKMNISNFEYDFAVEKSVIRESQ